MSSLVEMMKQTNLTYNALHGEFCSNLANEIAKCEDKKDRKGTYNTALKLAKKYEKQLRTNQYKMCHLQKYGLFGGGSIVELDGSVIVYGNVQYFE